MDLNHRPTAYESAALPLSYAATSKLVYGFRRGLTASLHPVTVSPLPLKSCDFGDPQSPGTEEIFNFLGKGGVA